MADVEEGQQEEVEAGENVVHDAGVVMQAPADEGDAQGQPDNVPLGAPVPAGVGLAPELLNPIQGPPAVTPVVGNTWWKRDLKISGQVGDRKSGLGYVSLVRQIENAVVKGYSEAEVVEAVIRSIQPGLRLRSYLEGRADLALPVLRKIIRSHYQESSASELYQELSGTYQLPREEPLEFILRAMDTRQKILFASQEADSALKYNADLVNAMFRHAVYTGLSSEVVRQEMRTLLHDPVVTDETIISHLNSIISQETERKNKFERIGRNTKLMKAEAEEASNPAEGALAAEMKELKIQMARLGDAVKARQAPEPNSKELSEMRVEIARLKELVTQTSGGNSRPTEDRVDSRRSRSTWARGCEECNRNGQGDSCQHCWKCGSAEHWRRGCRAARQREPHHPGNDNGSGWRGQT